MLTIASSKLRTGPVEYFSAELGYEITPAGLKNLLDKTPNNVCVVDVRDAKQYDAGHIPSARNIPIYTLVSSFSSLPKDMMIVTYCGDIACGLSLKAALELAQKGFLVQQLIGGFTEWSRKGFPIETTPSPAPSQS